MRPRLFQDCLDEADLVRHEAFADDALTLLLGDPMGQAAWAAGVRAGIAGALQVVNRRYTLDPREPM